MNKLLIAFFVITSSIVFAQQDTIFWFAAPDASSIIGQSPITITVSTYAQPAQVTISQPANGLFVPIVVTLAANQTQNIDLSAFLASIESPSADVVNNNGLKIEATAIISAYYTLNAPNNKEMFSLKGNTGLGTNFYTPFQKFWNNANITPAAFSSFEIVASENNTTVLITPRTPIVGHGLNATFSVVLNAGQTYSARDLNITAASSLAGSLISANKPVSVTVFDGALSNGACIDAIGDQIPSAAAIGKEYVARKGQGSDERLYILATQNATNVTITNSVATNLILNWSETSEFILLEDINYISSNKPIYVFHISGNGCELSSAVIPPAFCAGGYEVDFNRSSTDSLGVLLYTRAGFENQFLLNGLAGAINAGDFTVVPGTSGQLVSAKVFFDIATIPAGVFSKIENTGDLFGMGLISGSSTSASSFGYLSNWQTSSIVNAGMNDTVCANVGFPINGLIGGGPITGIWSGTGYGSFQNATNSLSNTYIPSVLDVFVSPVKLILTSTGVCPVKKDTLFLVVSPPPNVNASADQSVCANNANILLNGNVQGGANSGIWTTLGTGTFVSNASQLNATYLPSASDLSSGSVQFVLTSTNNGTCIAETDTMMVTITQPAVVDAGVDTIYVCANNATVTLSGTVIGSSTTGKWISTGTGNFTPNNVNLNTTYQPSNADITSGVTTIYLESTSNGNCLPVRDSIKIIYTASPVVDAGVNQLKCSNASVVNLNGVVSGASGTGIWSGGSGTFSPSNTSLTATYTPTTTEIASGNMVLTLSATNIMGCNAVSDMMQIVFVAPPFANFSSNEVCLNKQTNFVNLSAPGFGSIVSSAWNFGDNTTSSLTNPNHTYGTNGSFTATLIITNSNGCTDTVASTITVNSLPDAAFIYSSSCPNNQITLDFTDQSTATDPINFWYYDFGGQGISNLANSSQIFNSQGSYIITHVVGTNKGCRDTTIQTINILPTPIAGFTYNTNNGLNVGAVFNFVDTSLYSNTFSWTFGDNSTGNVQNPSHTYFQNGNYLVTQYVSNSLGCLDSAAVFISINTVTNEINTLIPNAISPNGDGFNDIWKLEFIDLLFPKATVEIYNQWGQQLYYSEGYSIPWDGKYNNEDVPDGNYYYVINLNAGLEQDIFKGALLVLKSKK